MLLVGPIDPKGRFKGGIAYIMNSILNYPSLEKMGLDIVPFDTCDIQRTNNGTGRVNINNIKNALVNMHKLSLSIKKNAPQIIYFNTSRGKGLIKDVFNIVIANRKKTSKVILHIHYAEIADILPTNKVLRRLVLNIFKKRIDHIVLLSAALKEKMIELGLDSNRISVIYNFHTIEMTENEIKEKIEISKKKKSKDIIFLGSLDSRKGIIDLLLAISELKDTISLHVGGEAKEAEIQKKIDSMITQKNLQSVELLGYVEGQVKMAQLKAADILVLPSYGEGFPIVIPEAMATGCSIITTNVGAIPEFFTKENGIMIEPGDVESLTSAIQELCGSEKIYSIMLHNWRDGMKYSLESFLKQMTDVCRRVVNASQNILRD